jgi:hypothetical protein
MLKYFIFTYIVRKTHGYLDIRRIWIWSDNHAHGYFRGRGRARLVVDLVLVYPSKSAPLPSLGVAWPSHQA